MRIVLLNIKGDIRNVSRSTQAGIETKCGDKLTSRLFAERGVIRGVSGIIVGLSRFCLRLVYLLTDLLTTDGDVVKYSAHVHQVLGMLDCVAALAACTVVF